MLVAAGRGRAIFTNFLQKNAFFLIIITYLITIFKLFSLILRRFSGIMLNDGGSWEGGVFLQFFFSNNYLFNSNF